MDPDTDTSDDRSQLSRPFYGHTFAEAGLSFWVPPSILAGIRAGFALALMALAMTIALTSDWDTGAFVLLTTAFWGPLLQAVGFLLLAASSLGMQLSDVAPDIVGCARLPDVAVPVHQTASAIALFSPIANVALRSPLASILGAVTIIFFLVDMVVLDAMVRFRLQYVWLLFVPFVPGAIVSIVLLSHRSGSLILSMLVVFAFGFLQLVCGVLVTFFTRIIVEMRSRKRAGRRGTDVDEEEERLRIV